MLETRLFKDYGSIMAKREGYGPIGNRGNGLILHSALAIDPQLGQPIGMLWQKLISSLEYDCTGEYF